MYGPDLAPLCPLTCATVTPGRAALAR